MKATQREINMPVDKELQKKILNTIGWSLGLGTFCLIFLIHFLFYLADVISENTGEIFITILKLITWD